MLGGLWRDTGLLPVKLVRRPPTIVVTADALFAPVEMTIEAWCWLRNWSPTCENTAIQSREAKRVPLVHSTWHSVTTKRCASGGPASKFSLYSTVGDSNTGADRRISASTNNDANELVCKVDAGDADVAASSAGETLAVASANATAAVELRCRRRSSNPMTFVAVAVPGLPG